jgi:hypothetical protein
MHPDSAMAAPVARTAGIKARVIAIAPSTIHAPLVSAQDGERKAEIAAIFRVDRRPGRPAAAWSPQSRLDLRFPTR